MANAIAIARMLEARTREQAKLKELGFSCREYWKGFEIWSHPVAGRIFRTMQTNGEPPNLHVCNDS